VAAVHKLSDDVGIPPFSTFGIAESEFPEIAEKSFANLSSESNPRPLDVEDYMEILRRLASRR
jgi:alcohol dehydrogenase